MTRQIPAAGSTFEFTELVGYKLIQNRRCTCTKYPMGGWRHEPECEVNDNGRTIVAALPVDHVIHWADNSIEAISTPDAQGKIWRAMLVAPHGDVC